MLVVDMQRGSHALGDHPRSEWARGARADAPPENQLYVVGATEVEVLSDDLFKEHPAHHGSVQHLREAELGLEDRQPIAVSRPAIAGGKRMRQAAEPLSQQGVDLGRRQAVTERLQLPGGHTRAEAIIERLVSEAALGKLALDVLVPVQTELGVVGKVAAELQEERAEVPVHGVEVVVVTIAVVRTSQG